MLKYEEVEAKYRSEPFARKCEDFSEAEGVDTIILTVDELNTLGVHNAAHFKIHTPFDDLTFAHNMMFVLRVGEKLYLVNTEGYNYCRYIAPCVVAR